MKWETEKEINITEADKLIGSTAFVPVEISENILARITGKSLPDNDTVKITIDDLRYIPLLHYTADAKIHTGEIIVNKAIAEDVADIFYKLYQNQYPIERIRLIDDYNANDEESMIHNNSSSFCYRPIAGTNRLSKHSLGMAVDINPLYNPFLKYVFDGDSIIGYTSLQPASAEPYVDRNADFQYKLTDQDVAVRLFKEAGFKWGGDWTDRKDYQHFEK